MTRQQDDWDWEIEDYGDLAYLPADRAHALETEPQAELMGLSYLRYLRSAHWDHTRRRALLRAGHQCQRCEISNVQLDVHHLTYDRLGREAEHDLIVLCHRCHAREHGDTVERCPSCMQRRIGTGRCWYCGGTEP